MPKREPGLDLLRCVALLLVVTFHSFLNNGYYGEPQVGGAMVLAGSVRWLSTGCIGLFLMLTGYLKSGKTDLASCYRGLPRVLLGYLLASAISIPIRHFALGDVQPLSVWTHRFFGFRGVYYGWYVEMYVGLTLVSPFLNLVLERSEDTGRLLNLAGILLVITALPGATTLEALPDYWRSCYPVTYYILGAMVFRLQPKIRPGLALEAALLTALFLGGATVLSTDGDLSTAFTWEFGDLWIVMIALFLFLGLYRVKIRGFQQKVLAFGAGGCYGGYLLSHLLDAWCYRQLPAWKTPGRYWMLFFAVTVPIFVVSLLGGRLLDWATKRLLTLGRRARNVSETENRPRESGRPDSPGHDSVAAGCDF